jgi:ribose transport system permease protein
MSAAVARMRGGIRIDPTILPPAVMLIVLAVVYQTTSRSGFSAAQLAVISIAVLPLALVGLGQTVVVLGAGIDLSVGGVMSLGSAIAARQFGGPATQTAVWAVLIVVVGVGCGLINGLLVDRLRLQPFLVTLASWSILNGAALLVLPTQGEGHVAPEIGELGYDAPLGIPFALWALAVVLVGWIWFRSTRAARSIYAVGSSRQNAFVGGVSIARTTVLAFAISGGAAGLAALAYTVQTGAGDPTAGEPFILNSVAAVVIGGTRLSGGRGGFGGTLIGAALLVLIGNVVFAVGLPTEWTQFFQGLLLVVAILISSITEFLSRRRALAR